MCPWRLKVSTIACSRPSCSPNRACKAGDEAGAGADRERRLARTGSGLLAGRRPPTGMVSVAVTSTSARGPRPKSRRRRTSRADRITASPPRSRRTRVRASFIVLAR